MSDLLGTQETLKFQAEFLKKHLTDYEAIGRSRETDPDKGEQCTIFFRKERFEKIEDGQFWLSEKPEVIGSRSWDSSLPRIATWVVLKDKLHGDTKLVFLNTHFDHIGRKARHESAKLIRKTLEEKFAGLPVIVTGDFNCGPSSDPYSSLVGKKNELNLIDTFRGFKPKPGKSEGTFNGFRGTKSGKRIDWVLANDRFEIKSAKIDDFNKDGRYPSDHFPVDATLQWKK